MVFVFVAGMGRADGGISVYSRKVMIKGKADNILPDWLRFMKVIPPVPSLSTLFGPYLARFPPVFSRLSASSPPQRDGSNEPRAGTQGQETAGKGTKRGELQKETVEMGSELTTCCRTGCAS